MARQKTTEKRRTEIINLAVAEILKHPEQVAVPDTAEIARSEIRLFTQNYIKLRLLYSHLLKANPNTAAVNRLLGAIKSSPEERLKVFCQIVPSLMESKTVYVLESPFAVRLLLEGHLKATRAVSTPIEHRINATAIASPDLETTMVNVLNELRVLNETASALLSTWKTIERTLTEKKDRGADTPANPPQPPPVCS